MIRNEPRPFRGIERVFHDRQTPMPTHAEDNLRAPSLPAESGKQASLQQLFPDRSLNSEMIAHLDLRLRDKRLLMPGFYSDAAAQVRETLSRFLPDTEAEREVLQQALALLEQEVTVRDVLDTYRLALREV